MNEAERRASELEADKERRKRADVLERAALMLKMARVTELGGNEAATQNALHDVRELLTLYAAMKELQLAAQIAQDASRSASEGDDTALPDSAQ